MKYKRTCEVDNNDKYHNTYSLFISFDKLPKEFLEDISTGYVQLPVVRIDTNEQGLYIEEESYQDLRPYEI